MSTGPSSSSGSITSWFTNSKLSSRRWSMFFSDAVSRLSTQTTRWPFARRKSLRCEPMKPAPPVTTTVLTDGQVSGLSGEFRGCLRTAYGGDLPQISVRLVVEPHGKERELGPRDQQQGDQGGSPGGDVAAEEDPLQSDPA